MVADFIVTDPRTFIWNPETGGILAEIVDPNGNRISAIAWSPDGNMIAIANGASQLQIWNVSNTFSTGQVSLLSSFDNITAIALAWSPDSSLLAYSGARDISILNITTRDIVQTFVGHTEPVLALAWQPSGNNLLSGSLDHTVRMWDVLTGLELSQVQTSGRVRAVAWSPDGTKIAYGGTGDAMEIVSAPNIEQPTLTPSATPTYTPSPTTTPTATSIPTLTPSPTPPTLTPTPSPFQRLRLTSLCSVNPAAYRLWRIRNSNPVDVVFTWDVYRSPTGQNGFGVAPPAVNGVASEVIISTVTEAGANTLRLFVDGAQQDVKASSGAPCPTPTPTP
jgi:WD40 repeat protein